MTLKLLVCFQDIVAEMFYATSRPGFLLGMEYIMFPGLHVATIRLRQLVAKVTLHWLLSAVIVHIFFLNMLQPMYMYKLPEGTIQEGFKCPEYDDYYDTWRGYVFQMKCVKPLVFHCAKEYKSKKFIKACAKEKHCLLGEEPLLRYTRYDQFEVVCMNCFDFNRSYNPSDDTLSSTISQCPEQKLDCDYKGVRECPIHDPEEKYNADRKCMCDARNNYVPDCFPDLCGNISRFYCTSSKWEATSCYRFACPKGEERLIKNFTCVKRCDEGNFRPNHSDDCVTDPHYTTSTPTPTYAPSALTSSSSSPSKSLPTTKKSHSTTPFKISTSSSQNVSTSDTDYAKIWGPITIIFVGVGIAFLIVYLVKKKKYISVMKSIRKACSCLCQRDRQHGKVNTDIEMSEDCDSKDSLSLMLYPVAKYLISEALKTEMVTTVLTTCNRDIIAMMRPDDILKELFKSGWIPYVPKRDIEQLITTSEKNTRIFNHVYENQSIQLYDAFKKALDVEQLTELLRKLQQEEKTFIERNGQQPSYDAADDDTDETVFIAQTSDNNQDAAQDEAVLIAQTSDNNQDATQGQQGRDVPSSSTNSAIVEIHQHDNTDPGAATKSLLSNKTASKSTTV